MESIPQKELRNHVGEVLRRAESGEELEITVSGRPVARLLPLDRPHFVPAGQVREIYRGPTDGAWLEDIETLGIELRDPFTESR